jgi:hypothetical protein
MPDRTILLCTLRDANPVGVAQCTEAKARLIIERA